MSGPHGSSWLKSITCGTQNCSHMRVVATCYEPPPRSDGSAGASPAALQTSMAASSKHPLTRNISLGQNRCFEARDIPVSTSLTITVATSAAIASKRHTLQLFTCSSYLEDPFFVRYKGWLMNVFRVLFCDALTPSSSGSQSIGTPYQSVVEFYERPT